MVWNYGISNDFPPKMGVVIRTVTKISRFFSGVDMPRTRLSLPIIHYTNQVLTTYKLLFFCERYGFHKEIFSCSIDRTMLKISRKPVGPEPQCSLPNLKGMNMELPSIMTFEDLMHETSGDLFRHVSTKLWRGSNTVRLLKAANTGRGCSVPFVVSHGFPMASNSRLRVEDADWMLGMSLVECMNVIEHLYTFTLLKCRNRDSSHVNPVFFLEN